MPDRGGIALSLRTLFRRQIKRAVSQSSREERCKADSEFAEITRREKERLQVQSREEHRVLIEEMESPEPRWVQSAAATSDSGASLQLSACNTAASVRTASQAG